MGSNAEIKAKYDSLMKEASTLYVEKQFQKALAVYNDAHKLAVDSNMSKVIVCILKYMICSCLYESDKLEDLAEIVSTLQSMDRTVKNRFPAVYCLLAKTHCKLFRFELAEMEFRNADAIFTRTPTLEPYCIPGTDIPIRPTGKNDEVWAKIKEECTAYHKPDAICSHPECNYVAKPYVVPHKNIFLKDPAFNGMVIVNCNNKDQPCVLKFHQSCWKMKKDELYPITKVSDKDILGEKCFTPNCLNGDIACVISSIQVIDQKGELKAHIKEHHSANWPVKPQEKDKPDKNPKGAVKKVKVNPGPKKPDDPITAIQKKLIASITKSKAEIPPKNDEVHNEDDNDYYDESQIVIVKDTQENVDFSHELPEVAGEKSFLLSFFIDYIKKNRVTIGDIYSKFSEYNQDLHLKDLDILGFLLETNKFEVQRNNGATDTTTNTIATAGSVIRDEVIHDNVSHDEEIASHQSGSNKAKIYDDDCESFIDDVYLDLMNDKDETYVDCSESIEPVKNYNFNGQDTNFNMNLNNDNFQNHFNFNNNDIAQNAAGGGDASAHLKNGINLLPPQSFAASAKLDTVQSPVSPSKGSENRKLKDYITKLESDMEKILDENSTLKKEIVNKDADLESLREVHKEYAEKIEKCKELIEQMQDFQKAFDNMSQENVQMKEQLVQIMKEKNDLEGKVEELQDPEIKRTEFNKLFQEQIEILEEAIKEDFEKKADVLKKSLKTEIGVKMSLLNKLLNTQFSSNKHILTGYLERCSDFIEVTTKVNAWMEKYMNVKDFLDNSEWIARLELLQRAASNLQSQYSSLLKELHADKEDKFKMTDINLKTSAIPNAPSDQLGDVVIKAFNEYYRHQYQLTQNLMQNYALKAQAATQAATQAMQYQMHAAAAAAAQPQTYSPLQAAYGNQYPYASAYPAVQPSVPTTPLASSPPVYAWTPRTTITTGPPPNLTLQQATPPPVSARSNQASTPLESADVEKAKSVGVEQTAPPKVADVLASEEKAKDDAKSMKENEIKAPDNLDTFEAKLAQMREAFKTIGLNVKEKSKTDIPIPPSAEQKEAEKALEKVARVEQTEVKKAPEKVAKVEQTEVKKAPEKAARVEQTEVKKVPEKVARVEPPEVKKAPEKVVAPTAKTQVNAEKVVPSAKPETPQRTAPAPSVKDAMSIRDDRSDITTLTTRDDSKSQKKVGMDGLVKMLVKKFPGSMECDVIEAIAKIRKERNNALTGIPVSKIIEEAKPHIQQSQRLHAIRYFVNDGTK